jgi:predicted amidohydrolase YtcJ
MNPFKGMAAAVNAQILGPTGDLDGPAWLPDHALSVDEALSAYTVWPTRVVGTADRLGTLELGKIADLVILSADPLGVPPARLSEIQAAVTIVGGKVVFSRPSS